MMSNCVSELGGIVPASKAAVHLGPREPSQKILDRSVQLPSNLQPRGKLTAGKEDAIGSTILFRVEGKEVDKCTLLLTVVK